MITIREGCEGGELNFIGAWVIFGTISSKPHRVLNKIGNILFNIHAFIVISEI